MSEIPSNVCNNRALRQAARRVSQLYDRVLAPLDLRITQYSILMETERQGPIAMNALATILGMDRSTLGHNLKPLERDGLIALVVDEDDRRSRRIALTAQGKRKVAAGRKLWLVAQQRFERTFGPEPARSLRDVLALLASDAFAEAFERQDAGA